MYPQMELLMCTFSFLTSFLLLSSPAFLLRFSSFKGVPLSTIPNAHMEANKYVLCLPRYESFNVKVTWQIFSIPNVKTTMDFPEGTVFQKLCEIRLAGQERRNAGTTHIPWKTMGNGILIVTLGNALRWGSRGPQAWREAGTTSTHSQCRLWPFTMSAHSSWQRKSVDVHTILKRNKQG